MKVSMYHLGRRLNGLRYIKTIFDFLAIKGILKLSFLLVSSSIYSETC